MSASVAKPRLRRGDSDHDSMTKPLRMDKSEFALLASSLKATSLQQDAVWEFVHSPKSPSLEPSSFKAGSFKPGSFKTRPRGKSTRHVSHQGEEFHCCGQKFPDMHELVNHIEDSHGVEIFETEDFTVETTYEMESDDVYDAGYKQDDEDGFDTKEASPETDPLSNLVALLTNEQAGPEKAVLADLAKAMAGVALETGVDLQMDVPYTDGMPFTLDLEPVSHVSMHQILTEVRSSGHETTSDHGSETDESDDFSLGKRKPEQLSQSFFSTSITNHRESSTQRIKYDSLASPTRIFAPPRPMSAAPPALVRETPIKRSESTNDLDKLDFGFDMRKVEAKQESSDSDKPKDDAWVETDSDEEYHEFYDLGKGRRRRRDRSKRTSQQWNQGVAPPGPVAALVSQLISKKDPKIALASVVGQKEKKIAPVADGHVAVQQYHAQTLNIPSLIQSSVYTTADGERRYKCPHNGCSKEYKNPGGIKYHMQHAHFVDTGDEELNVVIKRPYGCTVKGCSKRYRNLGGLKYHIEHTHLNDVK